MFGLIRGYAQGAEAQGRPKIEACQLTAFRYFHFCPPRARKSLAPTLANLVEGTSSVAESAGRSSIKPGMAKKYRYQPEVGAVLNHPRGRSRDQHAIMPL